MHEWERVRWSTGTGGSPPTSARTAPVDAASAQAVTLQAVEAGGVTVVLSADPVATAARRATD